LKFKVNMGISILNTRGNKKILKEIHIMTCFKEVVKINSCKEGFVFENYVIT